VSTHLVIGHGAASYWSTDASPVYSSDIDLLARAKHHRLFDAAQRAGYATCDGELLGDAWLLVVGTADESDLDADPAVLAYCEVR
jgi:hypothetical protein